MFWERFRIPLMLAPTLFVIIALFMGGLGYGLLQSLGWQPIIDNYDINLDAYWNVMFSERYANEFWQGLALTLWVSIGSTFFSALIAILSALLLRETFFGKKVASFLFQLNLPIPHIVIGIGMLFLFSQSGLVSRMGAAADLIERTRDFPILVKDHLGIGIIMAYVWKEVPFIGVIVLAVLQSLGADFEDVARSLGANRWQRFRHVILPLVMPGVMSGSIIVFAFTFGSFEVPALLGVSFPRVLPVMAVRFFRNPDLNARVEGTAVAMIVALIALILVLLYMWVSRKAIRQE